MNMASQLSVDGGKNYLWSNGSTDRVIQAKAGIYSLTVTDENICTQVLSKEIKNFPSNISILTQDATCNEANGILAIGGDIIGASLSGINLEDYKISSLASKNYSLSIKDIWGCIYDTSFMIKNIEMIDIDIASSYKINRGDTIFINAPGISYISSNDADVYLLNKVIVLAPAQSVKVLFYVVDSLGCEYTKESMIEVIHNSVLIMPNIFSLNSSQNKIFQVPIPNGLKLFEFSIYDRWANKLSTSINVIEWDGTINGKMVDSGVYTYKLVYEFNEKLIHKYGNITVIK
jgi:gliding motility-associated-like protein